MKTKQKKQITLFDIRRRNRRARKKKQHINIFSFSQMLQYIKPVPIRTALREAAKDFVKYAVITNCIETMTSLAVSKFKSRA